jgi:hypothetical protein
MDDSNEESIEVRQQIVITHIVHEGSQDSDQELSCDSNQERVEIQIKNLETGGIKKKVGHKYMEVQLLRTETEDEEFWR